jgi:NADH pyrophosphatase NudC (nudix superfamily)
LFPRLRDSAHPAAAAAMMLLDRLEREHDEADFHHAAVAVLVQRWLAQDRLSPSQGNEMAARRRVRSEISLDR